MDSVFTTHDSTNLETAEMIKGLFPALAESFVLKSDPNWTPENMDQFSGRLVVVWRIFARAELRQGGI